MTLNPYHGGEVYLPGGRVPQVGEILRNPDWARTLRLMCDAEAAAKHKGRIAGIEAARAAFYKGEIAGRIIEFITSNPVEDASGSAHFPSSFYPRAAYPARVVVEGRIPREVIAELERRGHEVIVGDDWSQGKVMGIRYDRARGVILGGASLRRGIAYARGW